MIHTLPNYTDKATQENSCIEKFVEILTLFCESTINSRRFDPRSLDKEGDKFKYNSRILDPRSTTYIMYKSTKFVTLICVYSYAS